MQRGLCTRCASHCAWPPLTFMFMMAKSALMLPMGWMTFKHIGIFAETSQHRGYISQHVHFWCARDLICLFMLYALFVRLLLFSEVTMNATLTTLELWMRCEMWQSWAKRNVTKKKEKEMGTLEILYSFCWSNPISRFFSMWIKSHNQKLVHTWSAISERDQSRHDRRRRLVGIGRRNRKCKQE